MKGAWCLKIDAAILSPERLTAHFFPELPNHHGGALRLTSVCGERCNYRRRLKPGERPQKCPACAEKAK